jgi:hypothetical protein
MLRDGRSWARPRSFDVAMGVGAVSRVRARARDGTSTHAAQMEAGPPPDQEEELPPWWRLVPRTNGPLQHERLVRLLRLVRPAPEGWVVRAKRILLDHYELASAAVVRHCGTLTCRDVCGRSRWTRSSGRVSTPTPLLRPRRRDAPAHRARRADRDRPRVPRRAGGSTDCGVRCGGCAPCERRATLARTPSA